MKMPKKSGVILILAGAALIVSALSLFLYNRYEDLRAGDAAEKLLPELQSVIDAQEAIVSPPLDPNLKVVEIDGYGYVGRLSIPVLNLELPVMSEWDYVRLKKAPCRQFGSSKTDDLVIAAHNYKKHFGMFYKLKAGDKVLFTDMDGVINEYSVKLVETLIPTKVEAVQNSGHDLALYTCTYGGKTRIVVFCDR